MLDMIAHWWRDHVGQGAGIGFFKGVNNDRGLFLLKQMPHIHKNIIHVGSSKFHGSVLSLPFHFCYAVIFLHLEVGTIISWLVIDGVVFLEYKWVDMVGLEKMCGPILEVGVMYVKE